MNRPSPDLPEFLEKQRRLEAGETFQFACHSGVPCFNTCCADVNIILTPLDVLQLARVADMDTKQFLETRTANPITKDLQLPLVLLKMGPEPEKKCPFLGDKGCTVYEKRPWACGDCSKVCATMVPDAFNLGLKQVPAIRLPHLNAWPKRFVFDRQAVTDAEAKAIAESCTVGAINLEAQETTETLKVGAIVVATGWQPYPIENLAEFGGGDLKNVIANVELERMVSPEGPTEGKILRPSDKAAPKKIAFVQCAGSRDVNHLPYCSGVCCLASLKQALYVHEQLPDAEVTIYFIDRRAPGRNEDVLLKVAETEGVRLMKGKVGTIKESGSDLLLRVEDVEAGKLIDETADLVVLATGMMPNAADLDLPIFTRKDDDGFLLDDPESSVMVAGVARRPEDVAASVRDATGAVARAWVAARGRS